MDAGFKININIPSAYQNVISLRIQIEHIYSRCMENNLYMHQNILLF